MSTKSDALAVEGRDSKERTPSERINDPQRAELSTDVRLKLRKLEKLESKYEGPSL